MEPALYSYVKNVNSSKLMQEIADSSITISVWYISYDGTNTDVWMEYTLTSSEETTLNNIVTAHTTTPLERAGIGEGQWVFGSMWGRIKNRWLRLVETFLTSNLQPGIFVADAEVAGLMYTNKVDNSDVDLEIYKNDTLLYTWQIRTKRLAYKTDGLDTLTFVAGDRISVKAKGVSSGVHPNSITLTVHYCFTETLAGEGGIATL